VQAEIAARDERDRTRVASPLVPAEDAVHVDTTHKSIDEVVEEVEKIVKRVVGGTG
jgi:cytidylate kinase